MRQINALLTGSININRIPSGDEKKISYTLLAKPTVAASMSL